MFSVKCDRYGVVNHENRISVSIFGIFNLLCMNNVDRRSISSNCLFVVVIKYNIFHIRTCQTDENSLGSYQVVFARFVLSMQVQYMQALEAAYC